MTYTVTKAVKWGNSMSKHANSSPKKSKYYLLLVALIIISVITIISSFAIGYYKIPIKDILTFILKGEKHVPSNIAIIIKRIRFPRIVAAFMIGAGLSIAGASYQGMFKNPLVSPDILGVSTGAGLGAALAIVLDYPNIMIQLMAFVFGIVVVFLAYLIGTRTKYRQEVSLILAGTMLGTLCSSFITLIKYLADPYEKLPAITYWLMGSLSRVNNKALLFSVIPMVIGIVILYLLRWRLNILTLNDEEALAIGVNPKSVRLIAIIGATLISASSVCLGGIIGWVGLMIPHITRGLVGADYRRTLPISFLIGGTFLLIMDNLARTLYAMEIPLGVLTSLFGAPFFIVLIIRGGNR